MNTSRWKTITWFLIASGILAVLVFAYNLFDSKGCTGVCSDKSAGYKVGWRIGDAMANGNFVAAVAIFLAIGLMWLIVRERSRN